MSKTILLPLATRAQSQTRQKPPMAKEGHGFEQVGTIMQRMMINLAHHSDMLYEDYGQQENGRED